MKKVFISTISIILVIVMCIYACALSSRRISFTDVAVGTWYYEAVDYVYLHGVMVGVDDGIFAPDMSITRAMVAAVLARLVGADVTNCTTTSFTDVDIHSWYGKSVVWAQQNGIVAGTGKTTFEPLKEITREQICLMLSNFLDYLNLSTRNTEVTPFADADKTSSWAVAAVERLHKGGIVNGKENNMFDPKGLATRAEFAQIVLSSNLATLTKQNDLQ